MADPSPGGAPQFGTAEYAETLADSHACFVRGLIFGVAGAVVGLALYAAVGIITGLEIGYVALAVGYLVGKAITTGSRGRVGRRYQIAAALLTYAAVSMAAVPIGIAQIVKQERAAARAQTSSTGGAAGLDRNDSLDSPRALGAGALTAIGTLAFVGLTSPFLELGSPVSGVIGLVILFVGIRIAWQMTGAPRAAVFRTPAPPAGNDDAPTSLNLNR